MAKKAVKKSSKKPGNKKTPARKPPINLVRGKKTARGTGKKPALAKKLRPAARRLKNAAPKRKLTKSSAVKKQTGKSASPKAKAAAEVRAVVPSPLFAPAFAPGAAPAAVLSKQTPAAPAARDEYADEIVSALTDEPAGDDSEW